MVTLRPTTRRPITVLSTELKVLSRAALSTQHSALSTRPGGVAVIVLLMLIPLLAMVAFAVDLGYAWRTDAELQAAADAAALAGASQLYATEAAGNYAGTAPAVRATLVAQTQAAAAAEAVRFGQMHRA